jgi:transcriptional regulator GlxA family with amidase domain
VDIAIAVYEGLTALDAIGPYEVLGRLPGARITFVAARPGPIRTDQGSLTLMAEASLAETTAPDIVLVPGGPGRLAGETHDELVEWLRAVDDNTTWTTSVCTGALFLGAAGLLTGRPATTHWSAREQLAHYGVAVSEQRVVRDGKYVTAAGVSAGIDMALTLAGIVAGELTAQAIQLSIEYDPQPPYGAGSPATAPSEVVEFLRRRVARMSDAEDTTTSGVDA